MTFVYAENLEDSVYLIADTFWEIPVNGAGKPSNWGHSPLVKIVVLPNEQVVAFSGNSHLAETVFSRIHDALPEDAAKLLCQATVEYEGEVDFILADRKPLDLRLIENGTITSVPNAHLGSNVAFDTFQAIRHGDQPSEDTNFNVTICPEDLDEKSTSRFQQALIAFHECLLKGNGTGYGGFAVSYLMTHQSQVFYGYFRNHRGEISQSELEIGGAVAFNDEIRGGYQLLVGGGPFRYLRIL